MLGILALEFLFDAGVVVVPEAGQILRDLHRPVIGAENVYDDRDAALRDPGTFLHAVQIFDPHGDEWVGVGDIRQLCLPFIGQLVQWAPAEWENKMVPQACRECGGPMPPEGKRVRNVCNPVGEFPYCSHDCAAHAYWQTDLPAFMDTFERQTAR